MIVKGPGGLAINLPGFFLTWPPDYVADLDDFLVNLLILYGNLIMSVAFLGSEATEPRILGNP